MKEFLSFCPDCKEVVKAKSLTAVGMIAERGCQPCRLARHLPEMTPLGRSLALDFLVRSRQGEVIDKALERIERKKQKIQWGEKADPRLFW